MKDKIIHTKIILIFIYCLSFNYVLPQQGLNAKVKKVVFIIVDGISSDVIEKVATPYLDEISAIGGYTRAYVGGKINSYSETPTISAVGYNSLLTGTWVNKHNVWGNNIKDPNYNYWNIFRIVKESDPNLKTAIFSTWLDNRTKLIGEGLQKAGAIKFDYSFDGFELDSVNFPHGNDKSYISKIDEHVSKEAARYISKNGPDISWVYLEFTDDMGHGYGDSVQFYDAIKLADKQVGRIWKAVKNREKHNNEDWMIVITTDHGRNAETGKNHGGQSDRERSTWIVTNHQELNAYFKQQQPGIIDIMPSMMRHLNIELPEKIELEIDGTSFINPIIISNLTASIKDSSIRLKWNAYGENEILDIFIATTNNFKNGLEDKYKKILSVDSNRREVDLDISKYPSDFYKILIRSKTNSLNTWIIK